MAASEKKIVQVNQGVLDAEYVSDDEREIDLMGLFFRLVEKAGWIIGAAVVVAVLVALYTTLFVTPKYRSTAKLYVLNSSDSAINLNDLNIGEKLAGDYVQVFNNYEVYELAKYYLNADNYNANGANPEVKKLMAQKEFEFSGGFSSVQSMLDVNVIDNTRIIEISVTSEDPEEAMVFANVYALAAQHFIASVMKTDTPSIFESARVPGSPSSPNLVLNTILGCMLGGVCAAGFFIIQFLADDRVRTAEQMEKRLGIPTLGAMPVLESERKAHGSVATKKKGA